MCVCNNVGQGFDGHLLALQKMSESEGEEIPLFTDPNYAHMNHVILSSGALPTSPDGFSFNYSIMEDQIILHVYAYSSKECKVMAEHVGMVLSDIHAVFSSVSR